MEITALALFAPVAKAIDAYRYIFAGEERQTKDALIILGSWVLGTALVALVAGSSFVADIGLAVETWQDYILAGITLGSLAGVVHDLAEPEGVTIK